MALPLLAPLVAKGLAVAGSAAVGSGVGYGLSRLIPADNVFTRKWNKDETDRLHKSTNKLAGDVTKSNNQTLNMLSDLGVDLRKYEGEDGAVDMGKVSEDLDNIYAGIHKKLQDAGVKGLREDASLTKLHQAYSKLTAEGQKAYNSGEPVNASATSASATGAANGKTKAPGVAAPQGGNSAPLAPRVTGKDPELVSTKNHSHNASTTNQETQIDGLSDRHDTATVNQLTVTARNDAATLATNAGSNRKDAESNARIRDLERPIKEQQAKDDVLDKAEKYRKDRHEKRMNEIMEQRYKNRLFRDVKDWKNLGTLREGEEMLGEEAYDAKVGDLVKRAKKLRSAEGRVGLGETDLKDMDMVFKTVGKLPTEKRQDGSVKYGGDLTPAQLEALEKRISGFESRAKDSRDRTAARVAAFNRQAADTYREQYGLQGFSDEDVLKFHDKRRQQSVGTALDAISGIGTPRDADSTKAYEDAWDVILHNTNVTEAFNRAMEDQTAKDKFMEDSAAIEGDDADMRRDALRRSVILAQLNKERPPAATPPTQGQPVPPTQGQSTPQPQQPAESLVPGLLVPKKKDDTQAATLAGTVLRPRVRR